MRYPSIALVLLVASVARADGELDPGFAAHLDIDGPVTSVVRQPDGRVLIGGTFGKVGGRTRRGVARLDVDGTLDAAFTPGEGITGARPDLGVYAMALQADGKVVVGGVFDGFDGAVHVNLARLEANGRVDASFVAGTGKDEPVRALAVAADGKILVGGSFKHVDGAPRVALARLDRDGSIDRSFTSALPQAQSVFALAIAANEKIVCVGSFQTLNSVNVARLERNGALDASFRREVDRDGPVSAVAIQRDGKIVIAGNNLAVVGITHNGIDRLMPDGHRDPTFHAGTGTDDASAFAVSALADGKLLVGGDFTTFAGQHHPGSVRLEPDGTVDRSYLSRVAGSVVSQAIAPSGEVIVGGRFQTVDGAPRADIARLRSRAR